MTTSIVLDQSGLAAWTDPDQLEMYSATADTWIEDLQQCQDLASGATTTNGYTVTDPGGCSFTSNSLGLHLIQSSDDFAIAQLADQTTADGHHYVAASRFAVPSPFTETNGSATVITAQLLPVTLDQTLPADIRMSQFDAAVGYDGSAHATLINPASVSVGGGYNLFVIGVPNTTAYGEAGATSDFMFFALAAGSPDVSIPDITYATPFAPNEAWGVIGGESYDWDVPFQLPGTQPCPGFLTGCDVFAPLNFRGSLARLTGPLTPFVGPVLSATIDGGDLFTSATVSDAPTVAWQAPSVGGATMYTVSVLHATAPMGSNAPTLLLIVATLTTTDTTAAFPPGTLTAGEPYVIRIDALTTGDPTAPNRAQDLATSTVVSALMTAK